MPGPVPRSQHPPTCHTRRWPQSSWKWCKVSLRPRCREDIWLQSMCPKRQGETPQPFLPVHCLTYPKTLHKLLAGPKPDFSRGPGVSPGYGRQVQSPLHVGQHRKSPHFIETGAEFTPYKTNRAGVLRLLEERGPVSGHGPPSTT